MCEDPRKDKATLYIKDYPQYDDTLWGTNMTPEIRSQLDPDKLEADLYDSYQHPFVPAMHDAKWNFLLCSECHNLSNDCECCRECGNYDCTCPRCSQCNEPESECRCRRCEECGKVEDDCTCNEKEFDDPDRPVDYFGGISNG